MTTYAASHYQSNGPDPVDPEERKRIFTGTFARFSALIAWVLVGSAGAVLLSALLQLFISNDYASFWGGSFGSTFSSRAFDSQGNFVHPVIIIAPLVAVLLSIYVGRISSTTRVVALVAAIIQGLAALFGIVAILSSFGVEGDYGIVLFERFLISFGSWVLLVVTLGLCAMIFTNPTWNFGRQNAYNQQGYPGQYQNQPGSDGSYQQQQYPQQQYGGAPQPGQQYPQQSPPVPGDSNQGYNTGQQQYPRPDQGGLGSETQALPPQQNNNWPQQ